MTWDRGTKEKKEPTRNPRNSNRAIGILANDRGL
jgi:hypothetical protein